MPIIDLARVVHEIKTYPGAKAVQQKLQPMHPQNIMAIKAKIEKLLKSSFIYPIPLTD